MSKQIMKTDRTDKTNDTNRASKTELVFILDRSGSMSGLESDTVGGYNAMMESQRETEGDVIVTTVLFDDRYELLHDRIPLAELRPMAKDEYFVRGSTALIDAIGRTVKKIESAQAHTLPGHKAEKTIFVITTDGLENASCRYRAEEVRKMVEQKREKEGWEFIFLGANIDAVETAEHFGFARSRAVNYVADRDGVGLNYKVVGAAVAGMRCCKDSFSDLEMEDCLAPIAEDHKRRGKAGKEG